MTTPYFQFYFYKLSRTYKKLHFTIILAVSEILWYKQTDILLLLYKNKIHLSLHNILFQELKKQFKKKSMLLLPEKHPSVANAHSRFVELNNAFITVSFLVSLGYLSIIRKGGDIGLFITLVPKVDLINLRTFIEF